ncbi:hypothetical protein Tco_1357372, partial [Tanacetum coccineum]
MLHHAWVAWGHLLDELSCSTPIIAPTIPPSPDYTPASPDYSPAFDSEFDLSEDPSSDHIPPLPSTSTFLSSDDNTTDSDSPDTPPSPTHDSSSEASSDFHSDASSDSSSRHSLSNHSSPDLPSTSARPSHKRRRSPMASVSALPLISRALSPVRADLIPSPKRVRDSRYLANVEVDPSETPIVVSDDGDTPPMVLEVIPEPAQEERAVEIMHETLGDLVQRFHDHTQAIPLHRIHVIEGVQREQGHRIVRVESAVTALTERIAKLKRDNKRLRGTVSVKSQRVNRLQRGMSRMQRELRQIRRLRFYDRKMPNTRSGAPMTHEEVEELVTRRVAEEMEARKAARTLKPLNENGDEQEGENGGIGNGGDGGNGDGVARECTFQNFLKCKPHNFSGNEGVNSHKRTIGVDVAYAMNWLMTEVYCPRNEIQKMETELMVPDEEDRVERFIGGLPDNIQGNVIATNPARLQDTKCIANQLMDKKLQGCAA